MKGHPDSNPSFLQSQLREDELGRSSEGAANTGSSGELALRSGADSRRLSGSQATGTIILTAAASPTGAGRRSGGRTIASRRGGAGQRCRSLIHSKPGRAGGNGHYGGHRSARLPAPPSLLHLSHLPRSCS